MSEPRDVLLLCWRDSTHPQGGGSERYLERVGAELARRGTRVTLVTSSYPGAPRTEMRDGIRIIRAGGRFTVYPLALTTIVAGRIGRGPLRGTSPDVVVDTQNGIPFFAGLVAAAPTVVLVHHCHREQWPVAGSVVGRLGWFIESRVSPRVHRRRRYVTVSEPSAAELIALGVDADRVTVIRNGIDPLPAEFVAPTAPAAPAPDADRETRLCVLSRLVPHKQIEDALAVVADLQHTHPGVRLDVIGGGWWADRLVAQADSLGIGPLVTFHGHVPEAEKNALLASADIHLMPSRKEGWGLAVTEAAQHGVPTIGYRGSSGLQESVDDGHTGLLVDGVNELVSATRKLVDNPDEAQRLGDAARRKAGGYSWSVTADGFVDLFAELAADRQPATRY